MKKQKTKRLIIYHQHYIVIIKLRFTQQMILQIETNRNKLVNLDPNQDLISELGNLQPKVEENKNHINDI